MSAHFYVQRKGGYQSPQKATTVWASSRGRALELGKPRDIAPAFVRIFRKWYPIPLWLLNTLFRAISRYRTTHGRLVR